MDKIIFNLTKFALVTDILLNLNKIILFINEATTLLSLSKIPISFSNTTNSMKRNKMVQQAPVEIVSKHLNKMGINDRT